MLKRVPFLDHNLIKTAIIISKNFKLKKFKNKSYLNFISDEISEKKNITKYILKKTFKSFIPKDIIHRDKLGFPVSLENLFNNKKNINRIKNQFAKSLIIKKLFRKERVLELLSKKEKNHRESFLLWMFMNLDLFHKQYLKNENKLKKIFIIFINFLFF